MSLATQADRRNQGQNQHIDDVTESNELVAFRDVVDMLVLPLISAIRLGGE
jgi:hypothetical protein